MVQQKGPPLHQKGPLLLQECESRRPAVEKNVFDSRLDGQLGEGRGGETERRGETQRDWYFLTEQPAPVPHLARPEGNVALRILLVTVLCVDRSRKHFPDGDMKKSGQR